MSKNNIVSLFKNEKLQTIEQKDRFHNEKLHLEVEKMRIDTEYKRALLEAQREELAEKRRLEEEQREHEVEMENRKERHEVNILESKHKHEDKLKSNEIEGNIIIETIKGANAVNIISHETNLRLQEKYLTETYLDSESERDIFEGHAKARNDAVTEIIKTMAQGIEQRKTIKLQAKLNNSNATKQDVKEWIKEFDDKKDE